MHWTRCWREAAAHQPKQPWGGRLGTLCFFHVFFMLVNLIFKWPPLDKNEKQDPIWGFRHPIKSLAPGCAMSWRHLPLHAKTPKQHWPIWPSDFRILMLYVVNSVNSCFSQFCTACGGYNTNFRLGNCKATLSRQVPSSYSKSRFSMLCQMHSKAAKGHARHVLWWKKTPDYICVGWRKISWEMMRTRVWWVGRESNKGQPQIQCCVCNHRTCSA